MNKALPLAAVAFLFCLSTARSQTHLPDARSPSQTDTITFGFGLGLDYGGLGINLTWYPQQNIGLFGGLGYALAGAGYNAGLRFRLLPDGGDSKFRPYLIAMYGYNAAIYVTGGADYNRVFYGPSFGAGFDFGSMHPGKGYFNLAVLVPVRSPDVDHYIDTLRNSYGVSFNNNLLPIAVSIGLKVPIL